MSACKDFNRCCWRIENFLSQATYGWSRRGGIDLEVKQGKRGLSFIRGEVVHELE